MSAPVVVDDPCDAGFDAQAMAVALRLASRAVGRAAPNPAVGCVLVRWVDGQPRVLGRGWTQPGGRPHAETEALRRASSAYGRDALVGATAYVTLEPCNHHGKTPPCTEALIQARLGRVVVAALDPDPRVNGAGVARLEAAGVRVDQGVAAAAAQALNQGHWLRHEVGRPLVTIKSAVSLDGRIAAADGTSRWITGPAARAYGHLLRARYDAIMVGINTALADDPQLDCRLPGLTSASPTRVVLDHHLRLPADSHLARDARQRPTWVIASTAAAASQAAALRDLGVEVVRLEPGLHGRIPLDAALAALAERGITRLLVEGGARLTASFLNAGVVDRLALFQAPSLIGGNGYGMAEAIGVETPQQALRGTLLKRRQVGDDTFSLFALAGRDV